MIDAVTKRDAYDGSDAYVVLLSLLVVVYLQAPVEIDVSSEDFFRPRMSWTYKVDGETLDRRRPSIEAEDLVGEVDGLPSFDVRELHPCSRPFVSSENAPSVTRPNPEPKAHLLLPVSC